MHSSDPRHVGLMSFLQCFLSCSPFLKIVEEDINMLLTNWTFPKFARNFIQISLCLRLGIRVIKWNVLLLCNLKRLDEGQIKILKRLTLCIKYCNNIVLQLLHKSRRKKSFTLCIMSLFPPDPRDEFPKFELRI